jgi:hypothetical protein
LGRAARSFKGNRVLVVERFDRVWTKDNRLLRLPQEDCCQALSVPPTRKYEADGGPGIANVLELLKASDDPDTDRRLFLKAQIMFWLLAATDGHAKNFSIALRPGGRFRLTPSRTSQRGTSCRRQRQAASLLPWSRKSAPNFRSAPKPPSMRHWPGCPEISRRRWRTQSLLACGRA